MVNIQLTAVVSDWGFSVCIYKNTQVFPISIPLALLGRIWEWLYCMSESCRRDGGWQTLRHLSCSLQKQKQHERPLSYEFYMNSLPLASVWLQCRSSKPSATATNTRSLFWPHSHSWWSGIWRFLGIIHFFGTSSLINKC